MCSSFSGAAQKAAARARWEQQHFLRETMARVRLRQVGLESGGFTAYGSAQGNRQRCPERGGTVWGLFLRNTLHMLKRNRSLCESCPRSASETPGTSRSLLTDALWFSHQLNHQPHKPRLGFLLALPIPTLFQTQTHQPVGRNCSKYKRKFCIGVIKDRTQPWSWKSLSARTSADRNDGEILREILLVLPRLPQSFHASKSRNNLWAKSAEVTQNRRREPRC